MALIEVPAGLKGVAAVETSIGDVRGGEGVYHYRGRDAVELARTRTFEEVWYLLHEGRLPGPAELGELRAELLPLRRLPQPVVDALPAVAAAAGEDPLAALRAAYAVFVAGEGGGSWLDLDAAALRTDALRAGAVLPVLAASLWRLARGLEPLAPRPDLGHAANLLAMLDGETPSEPRVRALERYLILTADHGLNASTFTARVIASTGADLGSAVIGALGALAGPLHGGAPSRVLDMLDRIGEPEQAGAWLRDALARRERLMGFGHAVYRTEDPRSLLLHDTARELDSGRLALAETVEREAVALLRERYPERDLRANVELYTALVLEAIGLPRELFLPVFASSRVIGWTAHVREQAAANALIRPGARYVGPALVA